MKKTIALLFLCSLTIFSFAQKDWTYLIYLNGSDLESDGGAGTSDIEEMLDAGSTNNVNMVFMTGGAKKEGWETLQRFVVENGEEIPIEFVAPNDDMSDPQNLTDFIDWATQNYPADKYVLDLWNHGMGVRGYGHDENSDQEMKVPEFTRGIANSSFIQSGNRFEIIGFDACLMGSVEVQNSVQDYAEYFVGSEELEPGHGWNYTPIIQAMESGEARDGESLGVIIADGFFAQAKDKGTDNVTLSVIDLAEINGVVTALEQLVNQMQAAGETMIPNIQRARGSAEEYSKQIQMPENSEDMVDIGDFMMQLKETCPDLSVQIDQVLSALNKAVRYNVKDETRPNATGIAMFWPHNKIVDATHLEEIFRVFYRPIDFPPAIGEYLQTVYSVAAVSDPAAPDGEIVDDYEYDDAGLTSRPSFQSRNSDTWSAVKVFDTEDLEQIQVVLLASSYLEENEFVVLGSTLPDVEELTEDKGEIFAYNWDELWLGINGYPAYVADVFEYEQNGTYYTRVKIPAILNPDENDYGTDIIISYVFDEEFNITLESIVPESYGDNVLLTAKDRIDLKQGDRVMLLYEGFNTLTDEEFYVVDEAAVFTIENGNEDLELGYDFLDEGDYRLGYRLKDYSQNDTIIYDLQSFLITSTTESFAANQINMYPNPASNLVTIEFPLTAPTIQVELFNAQGQLMDTFLGQTGTFQFSISELTNGFYLVKLTTADGTYSDKLFIHKE